MLLLLGPLFKMLTAITNLRRAARVAEEGVRSKLPFLHMDFQFFYLLAFYLDLTIGPLRLLILFDFLGCWKLLYCIIELLSVSIHEISGIIEFFFMHNFMLP